jgi:hypothetical protein
MVYQRQGCNKEMDIWWEPVGFELWQKDYIKPVIGQREPMKKKGEK